LPLLAICTSLLSLHRQTCIITRHPSLSFLPSPVPIRYISPRKHPGHVMDDVRFQVIFWPDGLFVSMYTLLTRTCICFTWEWSYTLTFASPAGRHWHIQSLRWSIQILDSETRLNEEIH
jgi:hypothetical protein